MALIQERDRAELLDTLQKIASDVEELKTIRGMSTPTAVEMMQNIEEVRKLISLRHNIGENIILLGTRLS